MRGEHEPRGTRHEEDDHEGEGEDENRRDEARSNKQTRAGWRLRAMTLGGMLHAAACSVICHMNSNGSNNANIQPPTATMKMKQQ